MRAGSQRAPDWVPSPTRPGGLSAVKLQRSHVREMESIVQPASQIRPWKPRPSLEDRGDYNSQQHLQQPQQPSFPPDRGQVAMLTGAPGADRKETGRPRQ